MAVWTISAGIVRAYPIFSRINPSAFWLVRSRWLKLGFTSLKLIKEGINVKNGKEVPEAVGNFIGHIVTNRFIGNYTGSLINYGYNCSTIFNPRLLVSGISTARRSGISAIDFGSNNRAIKKLILAYHDASTKHVDVHLGHISLVYRVSGKPVEAQIKYDSDGVLTESSKRALIDHVKNEISSGARTVWNYDHTVSGARSSWKFDPNMLPRKFYGSGPTRQIILDDRVEFLNPGVTKALHFYAPALSSSEMYAYQLYPGNHTTAPILICGKIIPKDIKFEDRLHLKLIKEDELGKLRQDDSFVTRKYDGASAYFSSNGDLEYSPIRFYSPRISKVTGHRIEYTFKIPEISGHGTYHSTTGIGELLFWKYNIPGVILSLIGFKRGPEFLTWRYLTAAEIGGVLNSNKIRPTNIYPEFRTYRLDTLDDINTHSLPFIENRRFQENLKDDISHKNWQVVRKVRPAVHKLWEGIIINPKNKPTDEGYKFKLRGNENDWRIDSVEFYLSDKGNIAGIVKCTSLESGKKFNLGPGQVGDFDACMNMIESPEQYQGRVFKVRSFYGHEGRAAKVSEIHLDK